MKRIETIEPGTNKHNMMQVLGEKEKKTPSLKQRVIQLEYFQKELGSIQELKNRIKKLEVTVLQRVNDIANL